MKRSLIFALCAILVTSVLFVACSGGNSGSDDTDSASGNDATQTAESASATGDGAASQTAGGTEIYDDPETVLPGVRWEDLVPVTDGVDSNDDSDTDGETVGTGEDTLDTAWDFPESGIELPIIPLP